MVFPGFPKVFPGFPRVFHGGAELNPRRNPLLRETSQCFAAGSKSIDLEFAGMVLASQS